MSEPHEHEWLPIRGWVGRYRCKVCVALGWKRIVRVSESGPQKADRARPLEIVPYLCTRKGCGKNAITHSRSRGQLCRDHAGGSYPGLGPHEVKE